MPLNGRSRLVNRWQGRNSARRVYSARVHGCKAKMTAAVYQGENGEEEWREDISRYAWLRHPNLVQLFATASSSGIHAAIFHDALVPAQNRLDQYRGSNLSTVYIYSYLVTEFCVRTSIKRDSTKHASISVGSQAIYELCFGNTPVLFPVYDVDTLLHRSSLR
ncbi:hypothetical protein DFH09DRAFT_1176666 [Mycena vulgaris]|nr:hypothetical protein DFH09DRAFT_1176666 [Mycena vulgaris]